MVVTGYAIANAIILPASAWLSERLGRRKYYLGCILAFTLTSVACGLAPNLYFLIVFRIIQGAMGGALLPTSQTLIYEQFPKEKAGMAGAIFGMSVMIGPTLGPVLGGLPHRRVRLALDLQYQPALSASSASSSAGP